MIEIKYKIINVVEDPSVFPQKIKKQIKLKYVYYSNTNKEEFIKALKEMPDYECLDSERGVLIKEIPYSITKLD